MKRARSGTGSLPLGDVTAHFNYTSIVSDTDEPGVGIYFSSLHFTGSGVMAIGLDSDTYVCGPDDPAEEPSILVPWGLLFNNCIDSELTIPSGITELGDYLFERSISAVQARVNRTVLGTKYITYDDVSCYDAHYGATPVSDYRTLHYIKRIIVGEDVVKIGGRCFSGGYAAYAKHSSSYEHTDDSWQEGLVWDAENDTMMRYWVRKMELENDVVVYYSASPGISDVIFLNPDGLEELGGEAFAGCVDLEYIDFNKHTPNINGDTHIGERTFAGCYNLQYVNFDRNLDLTAGLFQNCFKLTDFNEYNEIHSVDEECLDGCISLIHMAITLDCRLDGQYVKNNSIAYVKPDFTTNPSLTKKQITYIHGNSCWPCCRAWIFLDNRTIVYDEGLGRGWPSLYYYNFNILYRIGLSPQPAWGDDVQPGYRKYYPFRIEGRVWYATVKADGNSNLCEVYDKDGVNSRNFFDSNDDVDLDETANLFLR